MTRKRLSREERETIRVGIAGEQSCRLIARQLARSPSTVSREIIRCGGREVYRAHEAHRLAGYRARRPKAFELEKHRSAKQGRSLAH